MEIWDGAGYRRTGLIMGSALTVSIATDADGTPTACVRSSSAIPAAAILPRLRRTLGLDIDLRAMETNLLRDPALAILIERRRGLRIPGAWDGFELAVRAVLGQQITVAGATLLAGRLVAAFGEALPEPLREPGLTHLFPTPERLAEADIAGSVGMPRSRARTIGVLARAACASPDLFEPGAPDAIARLCALPGIGDWTAQYIAMRALRDADAFPASDIGLLRALATPAGRPSPAQLLAHAEAWRPYRAYAAMHLWADEAEQRHRSAQSGARA